MNNLQKKYVDVYKSTPELDEKQIPIYSEEDYNRDNNIEEAPLETETLDETLVQELEYEEQTTLKISPSSNTDVVMVDTSNSSHENLSKLEGSKVRFVDFYKDARTFLEKANSTKFVLVTYILLSSPVLLILGYLSEDVYREILIIISLTYLGVDAYEKKTQVRKQKEHL